MIKYSKLFVNCLLLFTIPSIAIYPQPEPYAPNVHTQSSSVQQEIAQGQDGQSYTYDDVLDLIEELQDGDLEERCSPEELERIISFMALLAQQGILPHEIKEGFELEKDIQEILNPDYDSYEYAYSFYPGSEYAIIPSFYYQGGMMLCKHHKGWVHKRWDHAKKFVKKHKKAIIIGAVVVIAAVIVVGVVAAVTAGTAAAAASDDEKKGTALKNEENPPATFTSPNSMMASMESPMVKAAFEDQTFAFKEQVAGDQSLKLTSDAIDHTFVDTVRGYGSYLAHGTLENVSSLLSFIPYLGEGVKQVAEIFIPESLRISGAGITPVQNYENLVAAGHQTIDYVFSTNQSERYTPKSKERALIKFTMGVLPLPGSLGAGSGTPGYGRIPATQASNVRGWVVGQPIQNRTTFGTVPSWSAVRRRHWKNQAEWTKSNPNEYGSQNIIRMEKGLAPQRFNTKTDQIESMELHHAPSQKAGGLFDFIEVWPEDHAKLDPNRYLGQ